MRDLRDKFFGPSRAEVWRQLSAQLGARFEEGGLFREDRVIHTVGDWELVLDSYTQQAGNSATTYTRLRAPFVNPEGFRLRVYSETPVTPLRKLFGMQDITIGAYPLDEELVIQGNDEARIRELLGAPRMRALLASMSAVSLEIKPDEGLGERRYGDDVDVLVYEVPQLIKDIAELRTVFDLFAELLDELCAWGRRVAQEGDGRAALPEGTPRSVHVVYDAAQRVTAGFSGRPERIGDRVVAQLSLDEAAELFGVLELTTPKLPRASVDVKFEAGLPWHDEAGTATLTAARGLVNRVRNWSDLNVGDPIVDKHLVCEASEPLMGALRHLAPALSSVAPLLSTLTLRDGVLTATGVNLRVQDAERLAAGLLEVWRSSSSYLRGAGSSVPA